MKYKFNIGDWVRVKTNGNGCHPTEIGTITRITEQGDYDETPGYKTSPPVGNGIGGSYNGFTGEESFELETPSNDSFQKGDYIVILRPKNKDTVYIKNNWVYIQGKTQNYFYTQVGSDGEPVSVGSIEFTDDSWRYATQEEIEEYERQGGPYSLDKKPEEKEFIKGKWYKHFSRAETIAKFSHMEGSRWKGSEWISGDVEHDYRKFTSSYCKDAYEVSIEEIKHLLPPDHPDIQVEIDPHRCKRRRKNPEVEVEAEINGKGEFKKGDYIVFTEGKDPKRPNFPLNYVFKQRENYPYSLPEFDNTGSSTNGWEMRNFKNDYKGYHSKWRYATDEEKAEYNRRNYPFNVGELSVKREIKVGDYVRYKGTKPDGLWNYYFGSKGVIAGDVGVVSDLSGQDDIFVEDAIRDIVTGYLSPEDLELITEEEYTQGLRTAARILSDSERESLQKIPDDYATPTGGSELKAAPVHKSMLTNKKKSISIF